MKSINMKVNQWDHNKRFGWKLRVLETNLLIGIAMVSDSNPNKMEVYAFFHDPYNTLNESVTIKTTDDINKIHKAWMKCMDKLLSKMFF